MSGAINDPAREPYVRAPLLRVLLDGNPIPGALEASWTATSHFSPDTWSATFALNADPRHGLPWFDKIDIPAFLDIQVGMAGPGGAQWTSLGIGHADDLSADLEGGTVTLTGRDLGALLIETETAEAFQNQTGAEIAATIAARHGLATDIIAPSGLADRFYGSDHTRETHNQASRSTNEWDLLVRHAQIDACDLFLTGKTLHYRPLPGLTDAPYRVVWDAATASAASPMCNGIRLHLDHKLMLARPVTVAVKSFHSKTGKAVVAKAQSTATGAAGSVNGSVFTTASKKAKVYTFIRPNLTQAQADALAKSLLADIMKHERNVTWSEPATDAITPRSIARLEGTGSAFDQPYFVDEITRRISFDNGYSMDVRAKSHSSATTQAINDASTD
jgi:phage protein D